MDIIDSIYDLIKKDHNPDLINDNIELFQSFYSSYKSIKYNGYKLVEIYKYLLDHGINKDVFPTLEDEIYSDIFHYEMDITQSFYMGSFTVNDDTVDKLFSLINMHHSFKQYDKHNKLNSDDEFIRNCTGAMIVALNKGYFNLSTENIKKLNDNILNNSYLLHLIKNDNKTVMDRDYIFQYFSRFVLTNEFSNYEQSGDILLFYMFTGKIKDKEFMKKAFSSMSVEFLLNNVNNDLSTLYELLNRSIDDDGYKVVIFDNIYNKTMEKGYDKVIFKFLIKHSDTIYFKKDIEKIVDTIQKKYPTNLDDNEIDFMLNQNLSQEFLRNLKINLKRNDWSDDIVKKVQDKTKDIEILTYDLNQSLECLNNIFLGNKVDLLAVQASLVTLIKQITNDESILVYFNDDNKEYGCAIPDDNIVKLNIDLVYELIDCKDFEKHPEKLKIIETIFHECRHIEQFKMMNQQDVSDEFYEQYKEEMLDSLLNGYYNNNYFGISYEKDARVEGAKMTVQLLNKYFPFLKNSVEYYYNRMLQEQVRQYPNRKVFELAEQVSLEDILDKLVILNPQIIKDYPLLSREYNEDGTKKQIKLNNI